MNINRQINIILSIDRTIGDAKTAMQEINHLLKITTGVVSGREIVEIFLNCVMQFHQISGKHLLVFDRRFTA